MIFTAAVEAERFSCTQVRSADSLNRPDGRNLLNVIVGY